MLSIPETSCAEFAASPTIEAPRARSPRASSPRQYVQLLIERICRECPRRAPGSADEFRTQKILSHELARTGGEVRWLPFQYNPNLHAVFIVHFALAVGASLCLLVSPAVALCLHVFVFVAYLGESLRLFQWLRWLLPRCQSQNLLVTLPAQQPVRHRVVILGHADAAFTGWLFSVRLTKVFSIGPLKYVQRPFAVAMLGLLIVSFADAHTLWTGSIYWWRYFTYFGWAAFFAVIALVNLEILYRNQVVPGADDNLSSCAAMAVLVNRLAINKPADVELVFGVTGCEEAGTGGALALVRAMRTSWNPQETTIVALECVGQGRLHILQEGDVVPLPVPRRLRKLAKTIAAKDVRWGDLSTITIPAGATDALPFLVRGYPSICLGRLNAKLGAPEHYHLPSDAPQNLDYEALLETVDFVEQFVDRTCAMERVDHAVG